MNQFSANINHIYHLLSHRFPSNAVPIASKNISKRLDNLEFFSAGAFRQWSLWPECTTIATVKKGIWKIFSNCLYDWFFRNLVTFDWTSGFRYSNNKTILWKAVLTVFECQFRCRQLFRYLFLFINGNTKYEFVVSFSISISILRSVSELSARHPRWT